MRCENLELNGKTGWGSGYTGQIVKVKLKKWPQFSSEITKKENII